MYLSAQLIVSRLPFPGLALQKNEKNILRQEEVLLPRLLQPVLQAL